MLFAQRQPSLWSSGKPPNLEKNSQFYDFHSNSSSENETVEIRNVWAENVDEEMENIRELIETHPYVAMDTEFPGVVARPISGTYAPDFQYKSLKCNVDLLKIIQVLDRFLPTFDFILTIEVCSTNVCLTKCFSSDSHLGMKMEILRKVARVGNLILSST
mmetsp:Transcript_17558/g.39692  ORF Transcript_17558/g.39692 Transcript_17558/m.39692 type:complete len:160 (+) Transcript_17558:850-1329(+)